MGVVSMWSVMEIQSHLITDFDLNMTIGGKFKMTMVYSDNLMNYPNVIDLITIEDLTQSLDIEFDSTDP